jgi:hypothetical protein
MDMKGITCARAAMAFGLFLVTLACACTIEGQSQEPTEKTSGGSEALLGICQPLTCCFPSGGGWSDDPFEDGLRALGCTTPRAYTESYGESKWWLYSSCPASIQLTALVVQYATASPYYSQLAVNECLELHAVTGSDPTSVFVEWDPTCSSCYRASYGEGYYYRTW